MTLIDTILSLLSGVFSNAIAGVVGTLSTLVPELITDTAANVQKATVYAAQQLKAGNGVGATFTGTIQYFEAQEGITFSTFEQAILNAIIVGLGQKVNAPA